jgi:hypothetical protein
MRLVRLMTILASLGAATSAKADLTITFRDVGSDLVMTWEGSITGTPNTVSVGGGLDRTLVANTTIIAGGGGGFLGSKVFDLEASSIGTFFSGATVSLASSGSGNSTFHLRTNEIALNYNWNSGDTLSGTATWTGKSTCDLGTLSAPTTRALVGSSDQIIIRTIGACGTSVETSGSSGSPADVIAANVAADVYARARATGLTNNRMMDMSIARFIDDTNSGAAGIISRDAVNGPTGLQVTGLNVDADDDGTSLLSSMSYMDVSNGWRRVGFAELNFQDTQGFGSTLSISGRISQERYLTPSTLYGYFLGAELHRSNIEVSFGGDQDSWGVLAGSYMVARAENGLIGSAYGALGFNRSDLNIGNGTTTVTDSYDSRSIMLGAKLSGDMNYSTYRLRPSLATNYVQTHIGTLGMTETTGGTASDLSVAVGTIRFMDIVATPEFIFDLDPIGEGFVNTEFSVAPRLTCERRDAVTDTRNCGSGLALGLSSNSSDGMTTLNGGVSFDRIGSQDRRAIQLQAEMRF